MKILRAVIVTNHNEATEGVVFAIEAHPWHRNPEETEACNDEWCQKHHNIYIMRGIEFNFELRCVHPVGSPNYGNPKIGTGPIPDEDLSKFNADFGLYYAS